MVEELISLLRFRYFFNGAYHNAFAYRLPSNDSNQYRVMIQGRVSLIIKFSDDNNNWTQIAKPQDPILEQELLLALGQGLIDAELLD